MSLRHGVETLSREVEIEPAHTALLIVDVPQNFNCTWWDGGEYAGLSTAEKEQRYELFLPHLQGQARCLATWYGCKTPAGAPASRSPTPRGREHDPGRGATTRSTSQDHRISRAEEVRRTPKMVDELTRRAADEDGLSQNLLLRVHLDQHRLCAAQSRHAIPHHRRLPHRSMRRLRRSRRLRLGLSRDGTDRRRGHPVARAARLVVAQQSGLLPPAHHARRFSRRLDA